MTTAIVYHSVFHATERYARWLGEALGAEVLPMRKAKDLDRFDRIIVMSGTYASGMPLVGFLKKHWPRLRQKQVVAIAVGAAPADDPASKISYEHLPAEIREHITYAKIRGATPFAKKEQWQQEITRANLDEVLQLLQQ